MSAETWGHSFFRLGLRLGKSAAPPRAPRPRGVPSACLRIPIAPPRIAPMRLIMSIRSTPKQGEVHSHWAAGECVRRAVLQSRGFIFQPRRTLSGVVQILHLLIRY